MPSQRPRRPLQLRGREPGSYWAIRQLEANRLEVGGHWNNQSMVFATPLDLLTAVLNDCAGRTAYSGTELRIAARNFVAWAADSGAFELDPEELFTRPAIEEFIQTGLRHYTPASRGNMRSRLLRMSEIVADPEGRNQRLTPLPPADPLKPYSAAEVVAMRSWAATQSTKSRWLSSLALLGMGLGAGLSAAELTEVRTADVRDYRGLMTINVHGARGRIVPVLDVWTDDLREVLAGTPGGAFLFRSERSHTWPNVISNFVGRSSSVRPQSQRMRSTWVVLHLTRGVNVRSLVRFAGVDSLEAFTRYLEFVKEPEDDVLAAQLTGRLAA